MTAPSCGVYTHSRCSAGTVGCDAALPCACAHAPTYSPEPHACMSSHHLPRSTGCVPLLVHVPTVRASAASIASAATAATEALALATVAGDAANATAAAAAQAAAAAASAAHTASVAAMSAANNHVSSRLLTYSLACLRFTYARTYSPCELSLGRPSPSSSLCVACFP